MGLHSNGGIMNVIRCDVPSYLIWKWHPNGSVLGNNHRENSIRWGSSLRVKDGEVAVFVYKQNEETYQDFIVGPFDDTIKTKNLPILTSIIGLAYGGDSPFQAEVYFINLAEIIQIKFGVPYFDVFDPRFMDLGVPVAVRGTLSFKIKDYKEFIKLHRLFDFNIDEFQKQIKDALTRYIKKIVVNMPMEQNIPVVQLERKLSDIIDLIEPKVQERFQENFGVLVTGLDISNIEIDKMSPAYNQLKTLTVDITLATVQAQTEARVKDIQDKQRIEMENLQETLRIQREEGQYAQHKATETANFAAYQVEKQAQVGVAGAEALGNMGANGAGSVDLGSGGAGFNPAAMMASMAVGGVVGQNMAGMMNGMMSNTMMPPPINNVMYHVAVNGQATGPYDIQTLQQMAINGQLKKDTYVWKSGMAQWEYAGNVEDLKGVVNTIPPVPNN